MINSYKEVMVKRINKKIILPVYIVQLTNQQKEGEYYAYV